MKWTNKYNLPDRVIRVLKGKYKERKPELYKKIHRMLMMNEWILYKFSGEAYSEPTGACETELFDIHTLTWSKEILQLLDLKEDIPHKTEDYFLFRHLKFLILLFLFFCHQI